MLDTIFPIVEGHGEISAVPELLRRLAHEEFRNYQLEVMRPFRLPRGRILADAGLEKAVELGARKLAADGRTGAILVLLDADDDCPAVLAPALLQRITAVKPGPFVERGYCQGGVRKLVPGFCGIPPRKELRESRREPAV